MAPLLAIGCKPKKSNAGAAFIVELRFVGSPYDFDYRSPGFVLHNHVLGLRCLGICEGLR